MSGTRVKLSRRGRAQRLNAASTGQKTRVSISANPLLFGSLALAWALPPPRGREGRRADASLRRGRRYGGGTARATASGHLVRPRHGHPVALSALLLPEPLDRAVLWRVRRIAPRAVRATAGQRSPCGRFGLYGDVRASGPGGGARDHGPGLRGHRGRG